VASKWIDASLILESHLTLLLSMSYMSSSQLASSAPKLYLLSFLIFNAEQQTSPSNYYFHSSSGFSVCHHPAKQGLPKGVLGGSD
jgi:hypothetical protein